MSSANLLVELFVEELPPKALKKLGDAFAGVLRDAHSYAQQHAADGEEGLEAIGRGGQFDLVVSDVVMPSMDGPAMAREIRALKPDLPFLFMSGYAEEHLRREIDIPNMHFLAKPFSVQQIAEAVEKVLRGG